MLRVYRFLQGLGLTYGLLGFRIQDFVAQVPGCSGYIADCLA